MADEPLSEYEIIDEVTEALYSRLQRAGAFSAELGAEAVDAQPDDRKWMGITAAEKVFRRFGVSYHEMIVHLLNSSQVSDRQVTDALNEAFQRRAQTAAILANDPLQAFCENVGYNSDYDPFEGGIRQRNTPVFSLEWVR